MNPNANPYSTDANIFVGAPQQQQPEQEQPVVSAPPAEDLFGGMNVFGEEGGRQQLPQDDEDPFKEQEQPMFQQQEETIQFYAPEGSSGEKGTVEFTPPPMGGGEGVNAFAEQQRRDEESVITQQPPSSPPPPQQQDEENATAAQPPVERTAKCWKLSFYRQYFDVDTEDVTGRILEVGTFKMPKFMLADCEGGEPADMYGPIWIATTLWVALAVFGEIGEEIVDSSSDSPAPVEANKTAAPSSSSSFTFDFYWFVIVGMAVTYTYVFCTPLLIWLILKLNKVKSDFTKFITLYGYALAPFIPGSLLTVIPSSIVKLTVIFLTSAASLAIIVFNVQGFGSGLAYNWKVGYFASIVLAHALMTMLLFYEILFV